MGSDPQRTTRRSWLQSLMAAWALGTPLLIQAERGESARQVKTGGGQDAALPEDLVRRGWRYFLENQDPHTGLVKDRCRTTGPDDRPAASIAATGFGLTALCIATDRGWIPRSEALRRARTSLGFLESTPSHERGFFYHFLDSSSGARFWKSEASSIDTALLLAGVLTSAEYFGTRDLRRTAEIVYRRVEWSWLLDPDGVLRHGYRPESGILPGRWESYCEHLLLYLLALGSETHAIPSASWDAWSRPVHDYEGIRYIGSDGPLFVHQFSHAWVDFRGRRDRHADYWENSVRATEAHRRFCLHLASRFPKFGPELWGITASDSASGYQAWGGPPESGRLDGSIVPCAAAGSLPFAPADCLRTLTHQRGVYGEAVWGRYGFADAFNPHTGWVNPDVIGIDVGISMLMAENLLRGSVWKWLGRSAAVRSGMRRAGFRRS